MTVDSSAPPRTQARPDIDPEPKGNFERFLLGVFIVVPLLALVTAVPFAWGWGLGWSDIAIFFVMYSVSGLGVTVGFHRHFTHGSFKAKRPLRIAMALSGSLSIEMSVIDWVATHRRHHKYSDKEGDPHSPWRFGSDWRALTKGLIWAHAGWLFDRGRTSAEKFCPDLVADKDINRISRFFPGLVAVSLLLPPLLGGLLTMSWWGAATAFFWGHSFGSRCSTTSPGASTRSATRSARRRSRPGTSPATCGGWRFRLSASHGTTCTTPTRRAHGMGC